MREFLLEVVENVAIRLDVFIQEAIDEISRSRAKNLIESGQVFVNEKLMEKASYATRIGDRIKVLVQDDIILDVKAENIPLDIVYQDADLAIINKAQGMVTHPAVGNYNGTLVNAIMYHIKDLSSINGIIRPGIVHRLDKDTSGLIVIAKNDIAHNSLAMQISSKEARRFYIALVDGNIKEDNGEIIQPIARSTKDRKKMAIDKDGRYAHTLFEVVDRYKLYTLVKFELKTGRTHQIRIHSKYINHCIVGDSLYGGSEKFNLNGQLLHAYRLILKQPTTNEIIDISIELPTYFKEVLRKIESLKDSV